MSHQLRTPTRGSWQPQIGTAPAYCPAPLVRRSRWCALMTTAQKNGMNVLPKEVTEVITGTAVTGQPWSLRCHVVDRFLISMPRAPYAGVVAGPVRLWLRDSHGAWQQDQQGGSIHVMPPDHEQELGFWLAAVGGHWSAHRLPQYHGAELPRQDSSCKCRRFAIMCRKPTDYRGQQSSRQRQR